MRLRLVTAAGIAFGMLVGVPVAAATAPAPPASAVASCAGLPKHSNLPVIDAANVLDPERKAYLTADLMRFTMVGDAAMVAVTVRDLGGDDIAAYARRLFDCWGIGKSESNRGVLILVAMRERRVRVEIGKGLVHDVDRTELNDAVSVMAAPMKKGDVAGALREAAVSVASAMGTTLPDTAEFVRTGGGSEVPDLGIPVDVVASPGAGDFSDYVDGDGDLPTATNPFSPSPIGDGSWVPKAVIGLFVLAIVLTFARVLTGGMRAATGGGTWRGGFPTFGGGDRGWADPNLLHDGRWSTDGTWRGGGGTGVLSGSAGAASPIASGGSSGSGGSSPFGGGTSGGGASGTW